MRRLVAVVFILAAMAPVTAVVAAAPGGSPGAAFVNGGGRYDESECAVNFSIDGRQTSQGANGTQTATMSNAPGALPDCPGQGHVKATVTCVVVAGNEAEIRGDIIEQSGSFGADFFPPGDNVFVTDVLDSGNPSNGTPDKIVQYVDQPGTENNCQPPGGDELFTVDNGNVTVHG